MVSTPRYNNETGAHNFYHPTLFSTYRQWDVLSDLKCQHGPIFRYVRFQHLALSLPYVFTGHKLKIKRRRFDVDGQAQSQDKKW